MTDCRLAWIVLPDKPVAATRLLRFPYRVVEFLCSTLAILSPIVLTYMAMYGRYHGRNNQELIQHLKRKCRATVMQYYVTSSHMLAVCFDVEICFSVDLSLENAIYSMKTWNIYILLFIFESKPLKF